MSESREVIGMYQIITLLCSNLQKCRVKAFVFGDWAVHSLWAIEISHHIDRLHDVGGDHWRVSHLPSGNSIAPLADGLSFEDAVAIATNLAEKVSDMPHVGPGQRIPDPWGHIIIAIVGQVLAGDSEFVLANELAN